ncbi:MAG: glycosyltransferase [Pseudomonadota bacterium]|nr:glycosyltransferase [Pseudomonadota bacterium]
MGNPALMVLSPSALLSAAGLWRGPEATVATPVESWKDAVVDVVIHAHRHQHDIAYCLGALQRQSLRPRSIVLVDDGGSERDHTVQIAREFASAHRMPITFIERMWSIGRAPTLKRQARELDGDVLFALDADTVLESPLYIEHCVRELYQGAGVASVRGMMLPLRASDRRVWSAMPEFRLWVAGDPYRDPALRTDWLHRLSWWLGNSFRETVSSVQQRFLDRGHMALLGGVARPMGGAVAYRRRYLKDLFDRYEPIHGDDLTEEPELFIGFALGHEGYRNVQLGHVQARAMGPDILGLAGCTRRGTVAFLRSCRDFDALLRTPMRWPARWWKQRRHASKRQSPDWRELRRVQEPYRQAFGERLTRRDGRPIGWAVFAAAVEKLGYPLLLLGLAAWGQWLVLAAVVAGESLLWLGTLLVVTPGSRPWTLLKGLIATPLRYALIAVEFFTALKFLVRPPPPPPRRRRAR